MTRFVLLDRGEELSPSHLPTLRSSPVPVRLKLLDPAPPFAYGQVLHLAPLEGKFPRGRVLLLWHAGGAFRLGPFGDGTGPGGAEVVGRVVALERGDGTFSVDRGLLVHVPPRWLPRVVDLLEILRRIGHPFTPSLYLGSPEGCLTGVREKYDRPAEARQYAARAAAGLDPLERDVVQRHVKPGGRLLDVGCGAGREALGFARAGFRVVGIDIAPRMIEAAGFNAQREGLDITFRVQGATELDEPPGSFDGAYWAGSYHHVPGRARRVVTLRRIAHSLTADGVLILMVIYRGPRGLISRSRLVDFLRRVGVRLGRIRHLSEPGDGYMRETSEASDPWEACFFHDFSSPSEVRAELEAAGLSAEEVTRGWWVCRMMR